MTFAHTNENLTTALEKLFQAKPHLKDTDKHIKYINSRRRETYRTRHHRSEKEMDEIHA